MPTSKNDPKTLPKWAQNQIEDLKNAALLREAEIVRIKEADEILHRRTWHLVTGHPSDSIKDPDGRAYYKLFYLNKDGAHVCCTLYVGDTLLIGRQD